MLYVIILSCVILVSKSVSSSIIERYATIRYIKIFHEPTKKKKEKKKNSINEK